MALGGLWSSDHASAQTACPPSPIHVANASQLANAVACANATRSTSTTIVTDTSVDITGRPLTSTTVTQTTFIGAPITSTTAAGTADLTQSGRGTTVLGSTGLATYTGDTDVTNGTLRAGAVNAFSANSNVNIDEATIDLAGFNQTIGSLTGFAADSVTLGAGTLTVGRTGGSHRFAGTISGTGGVTLDPSAGYTLPISTDQRNVNFTLTGRNTYTGPTTINVGFLTLQDQGSVAGRIVVNTSPDGQSGGTLVVTGGSTRTIANAISGTGGIVVTGTRATFSGNNSGYGGAISVAFSDAGPTALVAGSNTAIGGGQATVQVDASTLFDVNGHTVTIKALTDGDPASAAGESVVLRNGLLRIGSGDASLDTFGGTIANGLSGGGGSLEKIGTNTLRLAGENSYAGGTTLTGGTVQVTNSASLGTGAIVFNGGTLQAAVGTSGVTLTNAIRVGAAGGTIDSNGANAVVLAGAIGNGAAPGRLTYADTSTGTPFDAIDFLLSGTNTTTGGAVIADDARVQTTTTNALGLGALQVDSEGRLDLAGADQTVTQLTGSGHIAANGYRVGTNVAATLTVQGGAFAGRLLDATSTENGTTYSGILGLAKTSAGTLVLSGTDTYSGPTDVVAGTLKAGSATALSPNSAVSIAGGATLDVGGFSNTIGSLADASGSSAAPARVTNSGSAAAVLTLGGDDRSTTFSGNVQDGASSLGLTKVGSGVTTLAGVNTYSGDTDIEAGTLKAGSKTGFSRNSAFSVAGGAILDLGGFDSIVQSLAGTGTVTNSGTARARLRLDGAANAVLSAQLEDGTGRLGLIKRGNGTLVLPHANSYSGGTELLNGTLAIGDSKALGTGALAIGDDSPTLEFLVANLVLANPIQFTGQRDPVIDTGSNFETISGQITGSGALTKRGTGTLDLTNPNNTYTGATIVAAGTLLVDGSIASSAATVNNGATISGTGTIGALSMLNGGTVASGGTQALKVARDLVFAAGSTYQVTVNATDTAPALTAGGTATLGNATLRVLAGTGTFGAGTYTLLTAAGGVSGRFASPADTDQAFALLSPTIGYTTGSVTLTLAPINFATIATTPNQAQTGGAIQALGPTSPVYNAVTPLTAGQARNAFDEASGVVHAHVPNAVLAVNQLTTTLLLDRLWDIGGNGLSAQQMLDQFAPDRLPALVRCYGPVAEPVPAPPARRYTAWGQGFGSFGHSDATANAGSLDRTLGGFVLGIDTPIDNILGTSWRTGVAGGYTSTAYRSSLDNGTGTVQSVYGSLYSGARYGAVDVRVGATGAGTFTDARRTFGLLAETETSFNRGYTVQGFGEMGYRFVNGASVLEPIVGATVTHLHQDGFNEKGGPAALAVKDFDTDLGTTAVGFRGEVSPLKDVPLVAHGYLAWQHVIGDVSPATVVAFQANPADTFSITGAPIDRDALAAEAALDYRTSEALVVGLSYTGLVGGTATQHSVKGRFEYRF